MQLKTTMMKLLFPFLMITTVTAYGEKSPVPPLSETVVFTLPPGGEKNWKEISRAFSEETAIIELIPIKQTSADWSELIFMNCANRFCFDPQRARSVDNMLALLRDKANKSHPLNQVTWKIIEKNQDSAIYECIERSAEENPLFLEHNIIRFILTKEAWHTVGFTKRNKEMSSKERDAWIKLLREGVSVQSLESKITGLSMIDTESYTISDQKTGTTMTVPTSYIKKNPNDPIIRQFSAGLK